jgi:hypothetical protein
MVHIDAGSSLLLIVLTCASVALSGYTILSYDNLIKQKTLCWIGIFLSVIICLRFISEWRAADQPTLSLTCLLPAVSPLSLWLAWLGVDRDQKMLKKLSKRRDS